MSLASVVEMIVLVLEGLGVLTMVVGFIIAGYFSIRALFRGRGARAAFHTVRTMVGSSILLGLEILVAADLIRTVMNPSLEEVVVLGIIVLIRTLLSFSIQIEIDGVLPWRRALLKNGGQLLTESVAQEVGGGRQSMAGQSRSPEDP